jgi:hypothetical protein
MRPDESQSNDVREQIGFPDSPVRPPVADRGLSVAAGFVALLIGIAVLKPWGAPSADSPVVVPPRAAATPLGPQIPPTTPRPTDDSAEGVAGPVCLGAGAWRVASLETWRDQDVRVWRAIEPITDADGPLDPAIPTVPVAGTQVEALGWCAPAFGPERPIGPEQVDCWIVIDGIAQRLRLRRVLPVRGTTHLAALYVPTAACPLEATCSPPKAGPAGGSWTAGRVVFRYADQGGATTVWFGADVELYAPAPAR